MTKFIDSLRKGLESAELARKNKKEINQIFEELSSEIEQYTESKVKLELKRSYEPEINNIFRTSLLSSLHDFDVGEQGRYYTAIIAKNLLRDEPTQELAEWDVDEDGYPVVISYSGNRVICGDRESLIEGLADFLSCTSVAEKISFLLS